MCVCVCVCVCVCDDVNGWLWQGYRTGHIYRDAVTGQRYTRSVSDADIAVKKLALANDATALSYVSFVICYIPG